MKPDCAAGAEAAARLCEQLGHAVEPADPGIDWADGYGEAFNIIFGVGMFSNVQAMARRKGETFRPGIFQPGIQSFLDIGARTSGPDYYAAVKRLQNLSRRMAAFHERYDVLLTPTLTTPPLPLSEFNYADEGPISFIEQFFTVAAFMPLANASGQPAMTVPLHRTASKPVAYSSWHASAPKICCFAWPASWKTRNPGSAAGRPGGTGLTAWPTHYTSAAVRWGSSR